MFVEIARMTVEKIQNGNLVSTFVNEERKRINKNTRNCRQLFTIMDSFKRNK